MSQRIPQIMVVDDDREFLSQMPDILDGYGQLDLYPTIDQALPAIESKFYDIAVLDFNFDDDSRTGLDLFRKIESLDRGIEVILVTGETVPSRLFDLFNSGIRNILEKPLKINQLRDCVTRILDERELRRRSIEISSKTREGRQKQAILLGSSPQMALIREQVERIVDFGLKDVLIQGETGTGKEEVAKYIAARADSLGRFFPINFAGLSEDLVKSELFGHVKGAFTGAEKNHVGVFEAARGGYVFLDEIGDMPIQVQPILLRALQERKIKRVGENSETEMNFRTISATHVDLKKAVSEGRFREDLYFRIAKDVITIPPLRERLDDIKDLTFHFLALQSKKITIADDALQLLRSHSWPGNVRELQTVIDNAAMRADHGMIRVPQIIRAIPELGSLPSHKIKRAIVGNYGLELIARERRRFQDAIILAHGDRDSAARNLGLSRATFFRKAKELGLVKDRKQGLGLIS